MSISHLKKSISSKTVLVVASAPQYPHGVVDDIEGKKFRPPSVEVLHGTLPGTSTIFATRVCRNCDARFSCSSYREYAVGTGKGERGNFRKYFVDFGSDTDQEDWVNANLSSRNPDEINTL